MMIVIPKNDDARNDTAANKKMKMKLWISTTILMMITIVTTAIMTAIQIMMTQNDTAAKK